MNSIRHLSLVALAVLGLGDLASAQVAYSTFGPADSYDQGENTGFSISNNQWLANPFTSNLAAPGQLLRVRAALDPYYSDDGSPFTVGVYEGASMNSAVLLESWSGAFPQFMSIVTYTSVLNPVINPGTQYWLAFTSNYVGDYGLWKWNDQGHTGLEFSGNSGSSWSESTDLQGAYDITLGDPQETPEPATFVLLTTGMIAMGASARLRRGKQRQAIA